MVKRMLWKDIRQTLSKSKGRVVSIVCLMALGSFALVGLKVTGPDMQATAADFYGRNNLADITVVSNYGISKDDERIIGKADGIKEVEYGYFKDVVISGTDRSMRIYSKPDAVSTYDVTEGRLPKRTGEIALDMKERDRFAVGSTLNVTEKTDIAGGTVLRHHKFTVVGFVRASETLSCLNMGQSTAGGGELKGYAVAVPGEFDSDVKMIARATYEDTEGLDYWSAEYRDAVQKHKDQLVTLLANQPKAREATIRSQQRKKIDEAKDKVKTSKQQLADAQRQLDDAKQQIDNAKDQLSEGSAEAVEEGSAAAAQLATAQAQLASANASVASGQTQLQAAQTQLAQGQNQLSDSWNQLANGKTQLDAAREQLETSKTVLDKVGATLGKWEQTGITGKLYEQIRGKYDMAINQYNEACAEYNRQLNAYNAGLQQYQNAVARLDQGSQAYRSNADNLAQASKQIAEKQNELGKAVSQAGKQVADGVTQLIQGQRDIDKAETEYQSKLAEFNAQKPEAERKISEAERQITLAEEKIDNLTVPAYSVSGRREGLTSQGYCVYMVIEGIVAKLADIFPIFLYFVAALVTFSTMGRMVDEERTNSGTLKALGYGNADVMLKFTVYGFAASTLGTCIGVLAGHTLLPLIVAHAYSAGFTMPDIMLKFHPWITMAAFALAWISAVVPAWLAASKELREKPASLLLPKPPAKGSKILLEHFPPLWNRLNFTHKVTARNIFRYKTRMFMTIFGVCGAVSLLTAGLAVQSSIGQIGNRQFEELIHYDLIVAEESDTNSAQREEIATTLKGKTVQSSTAVRYEELSKTAGKENDKQSITLLATDDAYNFNEYLTLRDRKTHQPQILVNNGAVISERLAEMLNVSVGDTFTVNDENGAQRTIKVAGISEMYIGHFIFMNAQCYEHVFGDQYSTNAYMVGLKDHSNANTERQGAKFMKLAAVRGVVQNTTQKNMVSTIVGSLNQIMEVLILVAVLLAVVILYNLTNLNVSERIRELSTIKVLGFHTSETTMHIYRETILLSLLGILAGYGFGEWLHRYIITEVPPDEVMFDPAISSNHNGDRALKQHRGPRKLMRAQRRPQWPGLHPLPGNNISHIGIQPIQQCGQFAGMRSDNDLRHNMARQQIQRAGINHNGRHALRPLVPRAIAILQRVMIQQRGNGRTLHVITGSNVTLGGHTGSNHPRLHPALAQHSLRQHGQYHILRTLRPQITHHAHIRARRGPRRQHGSTRIPRRTSHQTNHSTRILAIRKRRKTNRIRHKIAIRHLGKRNSIIDIETEIDQRDPSASIRSRRHHRTRLHRTERHRHIRRNIRPRQRTIINTHTRRRIDGHHQRQISGRVIVRQRRLVRQHAIHTQRRSQRASDTTQRAGHANPRHSIKHHMRTPRTLDRSLQPLTSLTRGKTRRAPRNISRRIQHQHTPTRTNKRPKRILMQRTANSNRGNLRTLTRQLSPRIQAIATIVPSASQHRDPRILNIQILIIKQRQRHTSHRRSSHTHQRHTIIQQRTLQLPDNIGGIGTIQQRLQTVGIIGDIHGKSFPSAWNHKPHFSRILKTTNKNGMDAKQENGAEHGIHRNEKQHQALPHGIHHHHRQRQRLLHHRTRRTRHHPRRIRRRQINSAQHPRRHGHQHLRTSNHRRQRHLQLHTQTTHRIPPHRHRLRIPVLQPRRQPHRTRKRRTRLTNRSRRTRRPTGARRRRACGPRRQFSRAVVGRRAAACGDRSSGGEESEDSAV